MRLKINGAQLCVDTIGDPTHPAVLYESSSAGQATSDGWMYP